MDDETTAQIFNGLTEYIQEDVMYVELFPRIKLADVFILRGKVSNLKYTTHVSGGKESVNTSYVATFEIDSQSIILYCSEPILIDMDDEVAIAGHIRQGIFKSTAYYNFRKKVYNASRGSSLLFYIFAFVFIGLAATALLIACYGSFLAVLISGLLAFVGYRFYHAGRVVFEASNIIIKKFCDFSSFPLGPRSDIP